MSAAATISTTEMEKAREVPLIRFNRLFPKFGNAIFKASGMIILLNVWNPSYRSNEQLQTDLCQPPQWLPLSFQKHRLHGLGNK